MARDVEGKPGEQGATNAKGKGEYLTFLLLRNPKTYS